jgi:hypothetical protein
MAAKRPQTEEAAMINQFANAPLILSTATLSILPIASTVR